MGRCTCRRGHLKWCAESGTPLRVPRCGRLGPFARTKQLTSLENVVTHGLQSLLESPSGLVAPVSPVEQGLLLRPRPRVLPFLKLLLVALGAPFCSVSVVPLVCPSRPAPRLLPTGRSLPTAAPCGQRLRSVRASRRGCWSQCVCRPAGRLGVANVTSTAGERDVTRNAQCGVRFGVKTSRALQCGPAAPVAPSGLLAVSTGGRASLSPSFCCQRVS